MPSHFNCPVTYRSPLKVAGKVIAFMLLLSLLGSCSTHNNVVNHSFIQKRKYTKGFHFKGFEWPTTNKTKPETYSGNLIVADSLHSADQKVTAANDSKITHAAKRSTITFSCDLNKGIPLLMPTKPKLSEIISKTQDGDTLTFINGIIKDWKSGKPMAGVNVLVIQSADITKRLGGVTDQSGRFSISVPERNISYKVVIAHKGYDKFTGKVLANKEENFGLIRLKRTPFFKRPKNLSDGDWWHWVGSAILLLLLVLLWIGVILIIPVALDGAYPGLALFFLLLVAGGITYVFINTIVTGEWEDTGKLLGATLLLIIVYFAKVL